MKVEFSSQARQYASIAGLVAILFLLSQTPLPDPNKRPTVPAVVSSLYSFDFNQSGTVEENSSSDESSSPYWWVNSGGYLYIKNGMGSTVQGSLPLTNKWRVLYAANNPTDTDKGAHPQNIFRLVSRNTWTDVRAEANFYIVRDNFSSSPNRNASNGLLLMTRYNDGGDTLYYAGIRVDGTAVIKKKYKGTYYTMAQEKVFPGTYTGTQDKKNLLPHHEWVALRSDTVNNSDGSVTVELSMWRASDPKWKVLMTSKDAGQYGDTSPITQDGYGGIRTDFMDVKFENFRLEKI